MRTDRPVETEGRLVFAGAGGRVEWRVTANGSWVPFWSDVNVLKLDRGDVSILKAVNCTLENDELYAV